MRMKPRGRPVAGSTRAMALQVRRQGAWLSAGGPGLGKRDPSPAQHSAQAGVLPPSRGHAPLRAGGAGGQVHKTLAGVRLLEAGGCAPPPVQHLKRHPVGRILEAGGIQDEYHVFPLAVAADGAEVAVAWNWWYSVV